MGAFTHSFFSGVPHTETAIRRPGFTTRYNSLVTPPRSGKLRGVLTGIHPGSHVFYRGSSKFILRIPHAPYSIAKAVFSFLDQALLYLIMILNPMLTTVNFSSYHTFKVQTGII